MRKIMVLGLIAALAMQNTSASAWIRIRGPRLPRLPSIPTPQLPNIPTPQLPNIPIPVPEVTLPPITIPDKPLDADAEILKRAGESATKAPGEAIRKTGIPGAEDVAIIFDDVGREILRAQNNLEDVTKKAGQDTVKEAGRFEKDGEVFVRAIGRYLESTVEDPRSSADRALIRIREGKFADALWHLAADPQLDQEGRAAALVQESDWANAIGQTAASATFGAGGAAAYASWYAYRASGDPELAIKAGLIAGASSWAMQQVTTSMPGYELAERPPTPVTNIPAERLAADDLAKKAIAAGAIGGLAVAASGGDGDAVREAFLMGAGMIVVQDGYQRFTGQNFQGALDEGGQLGSFCTAAVPSLAVRPDCAPPADWYKKVDTADGPRWEVDMSKVDRRYSYVGLASATDNPAPKFETSPAMESAARLKPTAPMAIFHDQLVISTGIGGTWLNQATIVPAFAVTYMGTEAGVQDATMDALLRSQQSTVPAVTPPTSVATTADTAFPPPESFVCAKHRTLTIRAPVFRGFRVSMRTRSVQQMLERSIFVTKAVAVGDLACTVVYQKPDEEGVDQAPYYAAKDAGFCQPKAVELTRTLVGDGWNCSQR